MGTHWPSYHFEDCKITLRDMIMVRLVVFISGSYNSSKCDCGVACEEIEYTSQVSYSEFPDDGIGKILKHRFAYNKKYGISEVNIFALQWNYLGEK